MNQSTLDKQARFKKEQEDFQTTIKGLYNLNISVPPDTEDHICVWCDEVIQTGTEYFWGRHGGEWHPRCYARHSPINTGMWKMAGLGKHPPEYLAELQKIKLEENPDYNPVDEFLAKYKELCLEYKIFITACGCCNSPWIRDCKSESEEHFKNLLEQNIDYMEIR